MGMSNVAIHIGPLLENAKINPHATLIALFLNAGEEEVVRSVGNLEDDAALDNRTRQYLYSTRGSFSNPYSRIDPQMKKLYWAKTLLRNPVPYFDM